jgi:hypothetical protein
MATTTSRQAAGARVPDLRWKRGLGIAVLAAALTAVPALARDAVAQRSASVTAAAYVTTSLLGARLLADSAAAASVPTPPPAVRRLRVAGLGVLDVQAGPGGQIRVDEASVKPAGGTTVVVLITYVST